MYRQYYTQWNLPNTGLTGLRSALKAPFIRYIVRMHISFAKSVLFKVYSIGLHYIAIGKLSDTKEVIDQLLKMYQRSLDIRLLSQKWVLDQILRIYIITSKSIMRA